MSFFWENPLSLIFLLAFVLGLGMGRLQAVPLAIGANVLITLVLAALIELGIYTPDGGDFSPYFGVIMLGLYGSGLAAFYAAVGVGAFQLLFHPSLPWSSKTRPFLGKRAS